MKPKTAVPKLVHANETKQREHDSSKAPSTRHGRGHRVHVTHFEQRGALSKTGRLLVLLSSFAAAHAGVISLAATPCSAIS